MRSGLARLTLTGALALAACAPSRPEPPRPPAAPIPDDTPSDLDPRELAPPPGANHGWLRLDAFPRLSGESDDTARLQRAVDSLASPEELRAVAMGERPFNPPLAAANTLFIPAGSYFVSRAIRLRAMGIRIVGEDPDTTRIAWKSAVPPSHFNRPEPSCQVGGPNCAGCTAGGYGYACAACPPECFAEPGTGCDDCNARAWIFHVDGAQWLELARLTLDGCGDGACRGDDSEAGRIADAAVRVATASARRPWVDAFGRARVTPIGTAFHFTDLRIRDVHKGIWAGTFPSGNDDFGVVRRVRFERVGRFPGPAGAAASPWSAEAPYGPIREAGVIVEGWNTLVWAVRESSFESCVAGVATHVGHLNAWDSYFHASRFADFILAGGSDPDPVVRGNTSIDSARFLIAGPCIPSPSSPVCPCMPSPANPAACASPEPPPGSGWTRSRAGWDTLPSTSSAQLFAALIADNSILCERGPCERSAPIAIAGDGTTTLLDNHFRRTAASGRPFVAHTSGNGNTAVMERGIARRHPAIPAALTLIGNGFADGPCENGNRPRDWLAGLPNGPAPAGWSPRLMNIDSRCDDRPIALPSLQSPALARGRPLLRLDPTAGPCLRSRDINEALAKLRASPGRTFLHLPAGFYLIDEPILVPGGQEVTILGDGLGTYLKRSARTTGCNYKDPDPADDHPFFHLAAPARATLRGLYLNALLNAPVGDVDRHARGVVIDSRDEGEITLREVDAVPHAQSCQRYERGLCVDPYEVDWSQTAFAIGGEHIDAATGEIGGAGFRRLDVRLEGAQWSGGGKAFALLGDGDGSRPVRVIGGGGSGTGDSMVTVAQGGRLVIEGDYSEQGLGVVLDGRGALTIAGGRYSVGGTFGAPDRMPAVRPRGRAREVHFNADGLSGDLTLVNVTTGMTFRRAPAQPGDRTLLLGVSYSPVLDAVDAAPPEPEPIDGGDGGQEGWALGWNCADPDPDRRIFRAAPPADATTGHAFLSNWIRKSPTTRRAWPSGRHWPCRDELALPAGQPRDAFVAALLADLRGTPAPTPRAPGATRARLEQIVYSGTGSDVGVWLRRVR